MSSITNKLLKLLFCSAALVMGNAHLDAAKQKVASHSSAEASSNSICDLPDGRCAPHVRKMIESDDIYHFLYGELCEQVETIHLLLDEVSDCSTYNNLYNFCVGFASSIPNGRVIVTLPDGTVVVDTAKSFCDCNFPECGEIEVPCDIAAAECNGYNFFINDFVNGNKNTTASFLDAQLWPCGIGCETRYDTTEAEYQAFVAVRLGAYLNSVGTVSLAQTLLP